MLMKNAVAALMGLAMVAEAASVHQYGTPTRTVGRRQFGKKNNFGNRFGNGQFGGGQNGQNNNNNNNGQNNNGQNNNGQNNNGQNNNNNNNNNNNGGNNNQASETCLAAAALQTGSQSTGQNGAQAADGQVNSATDNANFINFCQGKTLTNGLQNRDGSCNGIPMGEIPSANRMVSTVILNPKNGDDLEPLTTFQIQVNIANMQLGAFTNATSTYYSAPQTLNGGGQIIGHTHVTVQDTGNTLNPTQPLDATVFAFFKGINDAGNGNGQLAAEVTGGLPTGCYRVCTMSSASNHQPVLMPVAQRGSQEDCRYFSVGGACANNNNNNGGGNNNNNNNNGGNNNNNNNNNNNGGDQGQNNQGQNNQGQNNQGQNQGNQGQGNQGQQNNQGNQGNNQGQNNQGNQNNNQGNQGAGNQAGGGSGAGNNGNGNNGGNNNNNGGGNAGAAIAGIQPPPVTDSGNADRPFAVNGNTFVTRQEAQFRACAIQNNACAGAVNSGQAPGRTVPDCNAQEAACRAAA